MPTIPTTEELLQAGVHFGHRTSRWSPKMEPFIYTHRNGIHILDLQKTRESLESVCALVKDRVAEGKTVLFVGTKPQARNLVRKHAEAAECPFVVNRWIGGMLTNLPVVLGMIKKLKNIREAEESGELERKYTKKERLTISRDKERLESLVGGIVNVQELPHMIFVVGLKEEKTAVREALRMKIPLIALVDSNTDPTDVAYPIPANDDAVKSIDLMCGLIAEAVREGREIWKKQKAQAEAVEEKAPKKPRTAPQTES